MAAAVAAAVAGVAVPSAGWISCDGSVRVEGVGLRSELVECAGCSEPLEFVAHEFSVAGRAPPALPPLAVELPAEPGGAEPPILLEDAELLDARPPPPGLGCLDSMDLLGAGAPLPGPADD